MDVQLIDKLINEIQYGSRNFPQFSEPEHAGVCSAGPLLIGALIVCYNTRESLSTSSNAYGSKAKISIDTRSKAIAELAQSLDCKKEVGKVPNWQIDEAQEQQLQLWAEKVGVWVPKSDELLSASFGPMIAQGAEAKVFYKEGSGAVIKARTSIYATLDRALESIALHNYLFPETVMKVFGFTRDSDGLFRILLSQPYIECERLANKAEIDAMVETIGFYHNEDITGVNFISDRIHLEDMHPANVFVESHTGLPICIDCIVKFRRDLK